MEQFFLPAPAPTAFTPGYALVGGLIIGLSAALLWLSIGRIAGISGIIGNIFTPAGRDWRVAFLAGLMATPVAARLFGIAPSIHLQGSPPLLLGGGLLVGVGSALGGGCTSGHGICGLSRLSPRSIAATGTFMAVAMLVVLLTRAVF
jgi:uncharacterized membrane protein YedE/YeeE